MGFRKRIASLCVGLMVCVVGSGVAVASPVSAPVIAHVEDYTTDDGYDPVLAYVVKDGDSVRFDSERAIADGASEELLAVGDFINLYAFAAEADGDDRFTFRYWGNWCGPGHSGPEDPVDVLDTACMHHDKCYAAAGYLDCDCDQAFIDEVDSVYDDMGKLEKVAARAAQALFQAQKVYCKR